MPKNINYPAHVIAGRGRKIELIDGSNVVLVYGFASIMRIEDDFASIEQALSQLGENMRLTTVVQLLAAGLLHEGHADGALSDVETLAPLLDSQLIKDYSEAIGEAFELAFPQQTGKHAGAEPDPTKGETASPGEPGTTPQPSSSDAQMPSSGA